MDPKTLQLIIFAEQMAALAAQTITELKNLISGSSTKTVDQILSDADSTYQTVINNAKS